MAPFPATAWLRWSPTPPRECCCGTAPVPVLPLLYVDDATVEGEYQALPLSLLYVDDATVEGEYGLPVPAVASIADVTAGAGAATVTLTVTLSRAVAVASTIAWATADGTALAGTHYTATSGTLALAAGATSGTITVAIAAAAGGDPARTFNVVLSSPTGDVELGDASATVTIPAGASGSGPSAVAGNAYASPAGGAVLVTVAMLVAPTSPVTLTWATADDTATAGTHYTAASGTVTIPAGSTSASITIQTAAPGTGAAARRFAVAFVNTTPGAATLTNATALVYLPPGAGAHPHFGPLSTAANQIVNSAGTKIRLRSVNWSGAQNGDAWTPNPLWSTGFERVLDDIAAAGFNAIRLPFAGAIATQTAGWIDPLKNAALVGRTPLERLDQIIRAAAVRGIAVVLDMHSKTGEYLDGLPVSGSWTVANWQAAWEAMATRYGGYPNVLGADLYNEPSGLDWDTWAGYCETIGNAVHAVAPGWLIIVEGVGGTVAGVGGAWAGGNLSGVATRPVVLSAANKLVYSPHEYAHSVYLMAWLNYPGHTVSGWPGNLYAVWDACWGFIYRTGVAPLWIGEFGGQFGFNGAGAANGSAYTADERLWLATFISYLNGDLDGDGMREVAAASDRGLSFCYWTWNPNSTDTGGLLCDDGVTLQTGKLALLADLFTDETAGGGPANLLTNGDFGQPLSTGWTSWRWGAASGGTLGIVSDALALAPPDTSSGVGVSQVVATTVGQTYTLTFTSGGAPIWVSIAGTGHGYTAGPHSVSYTATAATTEISVSTTADLSVATIDDIVFVAA